MVTREGYITVADENHWQWHYSLDGKLIDDFVCQDVQQMEYNTGEKKWVCSSNSETPNIPNVQVDVMETANLLKYTTSDGWEGLLTRDGRVVTPPVFWSITAVGRNLYLCHYDTTQSHGILLNERGERVKSIQ